MKTSTILLFLVLTVAVQAQQLTGRVVDADGRPIEFANVAHYALPDSSLQAGTITAADGRFALPPSPSPSTGGYLQVSFVGYETAVVAAEPAATTIVLKPSSAQLGELTVTGNRPVVTRREDRLVFNPQHMRRIGSYHTLDLLRYVPGVFVGQNGTVVMGHHAAAVFLNDRQLSADEVQMLLQTIKADEVLRIEVRDSHGGEQSASIQGGIIYIYTRTREIGFHANLSYRHEWANHAKRMTVAPVLTLKYGTQRVTLYGSYGITPSTTTWRSADDRHFLKTGLRHADTQSGIAHNLQHTVRAGAMFMPHDRHTFGLEYNGLLNPHYRQTEVGDITLTEQDTVAGRGREWSGYTSHATTHNAVANYGWRIDTLGSRLNVLVNYNHRTAGSANALEARYDTRRLPDVSETNRTDSRADNISMKADFRKNFASKISLRMGMQYLLTDRRSTYRLNRAADDRQPDSQWDYREIISSGYTGISKSLGKWYLQATLRVENTSIKGTFDDRDRPLVQHQTELFPYLYASYSPTQKRDFSLFYYKSIFRPPFALLNNYVNRNSDVMYDKGNPNLRPQIGHLIKGRATFGNHFVATSLDYSPNTIFEQFEEVDGLVYRTNINFGVRKIWSLDYGFNGNMFAWWQTNLFATGEYVQLPTSHVRNRIATCYASSNNRFLIGEKGVFSLNFSGRTRWLSGNSIVAGSSQVDLSYSHSLLGDALNVAVGVDDLFNTTRSKIHFEVPGLHYDVYIKNATRYAWLSVSYTLQSKKRMQYRQLENDNEIRSRL